MRTIRAIIYECDRVIEIDPINLIVIIYPPADIIAILDGFKSKIIV